MVGNADLPAVTNLTIQGDPAAGRLVTPQFTVAGPVVIRPGQAGFNLDAVNVGLTGTGSLTFNAAASVLGCAVADLSSTAAAALTLNGGHDVLSGSTFVNDVPLPINTALVQVTRGAGSANVITDNTFVVNAPVDDLLAYQAAAPVMVSD